MIESTDQDGAAPAESSSTAMEGSPANVEEEPSGARTVAMHGVGSSAQESRRQAKRHEG